MTKPKRKKPFHRKYKPERDKELERAYKPKVVKPLVGSLTLYQEPPAQPEAPATFGAWFFFTPFGGKEVTVHVEGCISEAAAHLELEKAAISAGWQRPGKYNPFRWFYNLPEDAAITSTGHTSTTDKQP